MGKAGDTKKQIREMLETKNVNLTEISDRLGLAPSTVSQHLKEMVDSGQIRLADDRPRKWKYYELNRGPVQSPYEPGFQVKRIVIPIAGIILIAVLAVGLYFSGSRGVAVAQQVYIAPGSAVPHGSTVFSLSDSPQFYNISALFITVTNASVRSTSGKWYRIPLQERTFNLVGLRNISEILSGVNLTEGSYDAISLSVSNVTAIVNGTSRNVFLPSGRLFVVGGFNITGNSTNWVNIDVNLEKSLHLTGNDTLVMLPVLLVSHQTGNEIDLNSSSIVLAKTTPTDHENFECGMDMNGSMKGNFSLPQNVSVVFVSGKLVGRGEGPPQFVMRAKGRFIIGDDARAFVVFNGLNGSTEENAVFPAPFGAAAVEANASAWFNQTNASEENNSVVVCPTMGRCGRLIRPPQIAVWSNGTGQTGTNETANWKESSNITSNWLVRLPAGVIGGNTSGYADCMYKDGAVRCTQNSSLNASAVVPSGRLVVVGGSCAGLRPGEC
ncbi:MAG: DUF4382 domain-containing protein [Candidatus Micrarchaeota archaeon]|nr:DUF4382 domain-containing protein [Candidatus Micrarchaeota archaeon]